MPKSSLNRLIHDIQSLEKREAFLRDPLEFAQGYDVTDAELAAVRDSDVRALWSFGVNPYLLRVLQMRSSISDEDFRAALAGLSFPRVPMRGKYRMAKIVGAFAASHSPLFLLRRDMPAEDVQEEVFSGYRRMAREIVERGAEALVLLGNDHLHAFSLDRYPALAVGAGPRFGPVETEPFLPRDVYEGAEALASHLVRGLLANGFDPCCAGNWRLIIPSSHRWP